MLSNHTVSSVSATPNPSATELVPEFLFGCAGGFADTLSYLLAGSFTGHITGNLVLFITSGAVGHRTAMDKPLIAIGTFLVATAVALLAISRDGHAARKWVVTLQCALICSLELGVIRESEWFAFALIFVFATCLGLQNGLVGAVDGIPVHMSYMTGTATRLINAMLSQHKAKDDSANASILISSLALIGFASGSISAVFALKVSEYYAPMFLCAPLVVAAIRPETKLKR